MRRASLLTQRRCYLVFILSMIATSSVTAAWIGSGGGGGTLSSHRATTTTTTTTRLHASSSFTKKRASRSVATLMDWAESVGIEKSPALVLNQDAASGFGWKTTQAVAANDVVLQVPSDVALTVSSPGGGPDDSSVIRQATDRKAFRDLPWFCQFSAYLKVLKQQNGGVKNASSAGVDLKAWLASLPTSMDTPLHWSDAELAELQYDFMVSAVDKQKKSWRAYHQSLQQNGFANLSWDDFVWGCEMARSRAFSGAYTGAAFNPRIYAFTLLLVAVYVGLGLGTLDQAANGAGVVFCYSVLKDFVLPKLFKTKKFVICPLIDMANHDSNAYAGDVSFEFFGDCYSLAMTKALATGAAVCISYGQRSNDQWLQYYGFCEANNPFDVYVMPPLREWPISDMEEAAGRTVEAGRLQALERAGLLGYYNAGSSSNNNANKDDKDATVAFDENAANADGGVVLTRSVGLDPAVWQALRALFSTDAEWQAAGQAVGSFAESSPSAATETAVRQAAQRALAWELRRKATSLEQDEKMWQQWQTSKAVDASVAETLALQFRIEKKKLLKECLQSLSK